MGVLAKGNSATISRLRRQDGGSAVLYREIDAGPSGQRRDLAVAEIRFIRQDRNPEFEIRAADGSRDLCGDAGYTYSSRHKLWVWSIRSVFEDFGESHWLGYASSLAIGCDVLINGEYEALSTRNDARRRAAGTWLPNVHYRPSVFKECTCDECSV